nr:MAG TPA: hypothetical protein [Caudoviricetes sp.]
MKISAEKARIYAVSEIMLRVRFPPSPSEESTANAVFSRV